MLSTEDSILLCYLATTSSALKSKLQQLKTQYHNIFHMLCSDVSFDIVVVGAGCFLTLADSISQLMSASVAHCCHCREAEERRGSQESAKLYIL